MAAGSGFGGKPRPCVILQDDAYSLTDTVTVALCTTDMVEADFRIALVPSDRNGLTAPTCVMVDKLVTVPRTKIGRHLGEMTTAELSQTHRALLLFLGLTTSAS